MERMHSVRATVTVTETYEVNVSVSAINPEHAMSIVKHRRIDLDKFVMNRDKEKPVKLESHITFSSSEPQGFFD